MGALETIDEELGNSDTWSYIPNGKTGWLVLPEVFFEDDSVDIDGSLWRDGEMKGMRTAYLGRDTGTVIVARFTSTLTEVLICCAGGYEGALVWTQTPDCTVNLTQRSESSGRITMRGWFIPHLFS